MDASEYKNYTLGLIFYRFLSDKIENYVTKLLANDNVTYQEAWEDEEFREELKKELIKAIGYVIEPKYLFSTMIQYLCNDTVICAMYNEIIDAKTGKLIGSGIKNPDLAKEDIRTRKYPVCVEDGKVYLILEED